MTSRDQGLQNWTGSTFNTIKMNDLQVHKNLQKVTETKMAEKLNNLEKFDRKKIKFMHVLAQ